jgi:hypothetical protein
MDLCVLLFFVTKDAVLVSAIVVVGKLGAARFVEIFRPAILCSGF